MSMITPSHSRKIACTFVLGLIIPTAAWTLDYPLHPLDLAGWTQHANPPDTHPDWTTVGVSSVVNVTVAEFEDNDWLSIQRTGIGDNSAVAYYTGPDSQMSNFQGSVIIYNAGGGTGRVYPVGVVLAAQNATYDNSLGYYLGFQSLSGTVGGDTQERGLGLYYNANNGTYDYWSGAANAVAFDAHTGVTSGVPVLLEFSVMGSVIEGALWNLDGNDQKTGDVIATVSYVAESALSGYIGLRLGNLGGNRTAYFRDLTIIPEPASMTAVLGLAVLAAAVWMRRQRRTA